MTVDRATSPVVGKALEAGLVMLYIGMLTASLYGGVVPEYRTTAGIEVSERVLTETSYTIQQAVPPDATAAHAEVHVDIPGQIQGSVYQISIENQTLVLNHSNPEIAGELPLALPDSVSIAGGEWESHQRTVVEVRRGDDGFKVTLANREDR